MKIFKLIFYSLRDLITRYLPNFNRNRYGFAFLVHPRDIEDTYRKYPFFKYLPQKFLLWFLRHFWPVALSEVTGLKSVKSGQPIRGYIIAIPLITHQILEDRELAKKKIIQAIKLAEKLGAKIVGLGALTSSVTKGGLDLIDKVKINITNGNSLIAGIVVSEVVNLLKDRKNQNIAVVGATGSIGSVVSKILSAESNLLSLTIVGRTPAHLEELKNEISSNNKTVKIITTTNIKDIINADIVIVATNANDAIIHPEHIKQNAFVYDITQPKNTSEEVIRQRKDVKLIDGGIVSTPGINYHFNFGILPETTFACFAETMILAAENINCHYCIGKVETRKVKEILELAKKYNFKNID